MKNKDLIPILITGAVALLVIGGVVGALVQKQITAPQLEKASKLSDLAKSGAILSISAGGEITNILDRTVTLTQGGESLVIPIAENAEIVSYVTPETEGAPLERKEINFTDLKVGNYLSVSLKILPDGGFEGTAATMFSMIFTPR